VGDHRRGDEEHEREVDCLGVQDLHRGEVIEGEGDEEGEGPAAADGRAGEDAVVRPAFEEEAADEEDEGKRIASICVASLANPKNRRGNPPHNKEGSPRPIQAHGCTEPADPLRG